MKATLEFSLPDEQGDFRDATNGTSWRIIVTELDQYLRTICKHGLPPGQGFTPQEVRDKLAQLIKDESLDLYV